MSFLGMSIRSYPSTCASPSCIGISAYIDFNSELFPLPTFPMRYRNSPCSRERLTCFRTTSSLRRISTSLYVIMLAMDVKFLQI